MTAASLAAARPALHAAGFSYPLLTLRESALADNIEAMAAYCDRAGVALAPHGKTAMSPELAARQLARGAWGITVATIGQLQTYRAFGFPRLLLANELVDEAGIAWLAAELAADPGFAAYCYVDSAGRRGHPGPGAHPRSRPAAGSPSWWRSATPAGAPAAAPTPTRSPWPRRRPHRHAPGGGRGRVRGRIAGTGAGSEAEALGLIASFCRRLRGLAETLAASPRPGPQPGGEELIVTAGGSAYFDVVTRELTAGGTAGLTVILRSGALPHPRPRVLRQPSPPRPGTRRTRRRCGPRSSCGPRCCPGPSPAWRCSAPAAATPASTRACRCRCASCAGARPARGRGQRRR